jgi:prenyltransferase beta subunit
MKKFLLSLKNNSDQQVANPNNTWIRKSKQGEVVTYDSPHKVVATLPGAVSLTVNGEMDMRGVYCYMVVADILNLVDQELTRGIADFIKSC